MTNKTENNMQQEKPVLYDTTPIIKLIRFIPTRAVLFADRVSDKIGWRKGNDIIDNIRGRSKPGREEMEVYSELLFCSITDIEKCYETKITINREEQNGKRN